MIPINLNNMGGIFNIPQNIINLKEGTIEAVETIGSLAKVIIQALDNIKTVLLNPIIILTFIDKLTIVILISLIVLKMLGFHDLEKWIMLSILIKVIAMIFI